MTGTAFRCTAWRRATGDSRFDLGCQARECWPLKAKLGEQIEDYVILGACNPPLAYRALAADRSIGLLLPCNVVVRATPAGTVVEVLDPQIMATLTGQPELKPVADEAARRLAAALADLKERGQE